MWFRIKLTDRLENETTNMTASDITNDVSNFDVTANAEQIPKICKAIGLLLNKGSSKISLYFFIYISSLRFSKKGP